MAIDQRDITSQLRMMDDRVLQQYAAMHKSDPYIFPLAFQESQNRQKIRMSGQARMAGQEMPKVNDAALMAMTPQAAPQQAPQGQGISDLPAPNMQRMADGGIAGYGDDEEGMAAGGMAGYGDGDDVPRRTIDGMAQGGMYDFAQRSEPVVRMSGGGVPGYKEQGLVKRLPPVNELGGNVLPTTSGYEGMGIGEFLSQAGSDIYDTVSPYLTLKSQEENVAERNKKRKKQKQEDEYAEKAKLMKGYKPMRSADDAEFDIEEAEIKARDNPPFIYDEETKKMVRNPNASKADVVADKPTPPKPSAGGTGTGGGKAKTKVEAPAPTPDALASLGIVPYGQSKRGDAPATPAYTPQTAEEIRARSEALAKPELEKIQASYKPFGEQFAQDRSRIDTREKNMLSDALIRGGLKTMGGKSQFAMQNISEGGLEALNVYQETQKTNDAARKALTQSEMLMSQAQRAEERGARGEAVSLFAQADKSQQVGLQLQQKAQELANTEKYQQGVLEHYKRADVTSGRMADAAMVSAQNRGAGAGAMALSREAQLQLNAAKLELSDISKQLEKDIRLNLPKNAEMKARLESRRNQLRADIAKLGGSDTISQLPPTGSGSGIDLSQWGKASVEPTR